MKKHLKKHRGRYAVALAVVATVALTTLHHGHDGILPDSSMTPGVTNPDISQANIDQTICNTGNWTTKSIRPPVSYTSPLKVKQIAEYGYSDTSTASYEEDHLIALTLGGNPTDPKNLWPQSYNTTPNAKDKDRVEMYLHAQVCSGALTLKEAQKEISTDWTAVYKTMGIFGALGVVDEDDQ